MTTVTVVGGDPKSGRNLVAEAIREHITSVVKLNAIAVGKYESDFWIEIIGNPDDIILISESSGREPWMEPWFTKYGEPLFEIHIKRNDQ